MLSMRLSTNGNNSTKAWSRQKDERAQKRFDKPRRQAYNDFGHMPKICKPERNDQ